MADAKSTLARDGTMQVTAKEGIELLKSEGCDKLLKAQGLISDAGDSSADKPALNRDGTMAVTAKEGEAVLESLGGAPDADAATRGQQKKLEEIQKEPVAKKPKLAKDGTMVATAKEGKALVGSEKLGDTRQETKRKSDKPTPKRDSTITKAVEEAKVLFPDTDINVNEGRRTRSGNKPSPSTKPAVKRAGTMQKTAKEGKEFLKRKSAENSDAAAEEEATTEENTEEEKKDA